MASASLFAMEDPPVLLEAPWSAVALLCLSTLIHILNSSMASAKSLHAPMEALHTLVDVHALKHGQELPVP